MDNGRTWTIDGHGQWSDMDNGRAWTSLRFLAPGCWLARARVYRTHQITPDERRAPRSRPLTREQSAALRVRAHTRIVTLVSVQATNGTKGAEEAETNFKCLTQCSDLYHAVAEQLGDKADEVAPNRVMLQGGTKLGTGHLGILEGNDTHKPVELGARYRGDRFDMLGRVAFGGFIDQKFYVDRLHRIIKSMGTEKNKLHDSLFIRLTSEEYRAALHVMALWW